MATSVADSLEKSSSRRSLSRATASSMSSCLNRLRLAHRDGHAVREAEERRDVAGGDLGEALGPDRSWQGLEHARAEPALRGEHGGDSHVEMRAP